MNSMRRFLQGMLLVWGIGGAQISSGQVVERLIAVIEDQAITQSDLSDRLKFVLIVTRLPATP